MSNRWRKKFPNISNNKEFLLQKNTMRNRYILFALGVNFKLGRIKINIEPPKRSVRLEFFVIKEKIKIIGKSLK